mmetsp:Transcript_7376/g.24196  ORF Transcript_7376/g.24196 Transcript_7376/m.24196 type:complete len:204 (+) Transcript_7376:1133-1744(+)
MAPPRLRAFRKFLGRDPPGARQTRRGGTGELVARRLDGGMHLLPVTGRHPALLHAPHRAVPMLRPPHRYCPVAAVTPAHLPRRRPPLRRRSVGFGAGPGRRGPVWNRSLWGTDAPGQAEAVAVGACVCGLYRGSRILFRVSGHRSPRPQRHARARPRPRRPGRRVYSGHPHLLGHRRRRRRAILARGGEAAHPAEYRPGRASG